MKTLAVVVGAATTVVLTSACGVPMRAGADFDRGLDLTGYGTFTWESQDALPTGDPRLDDNPFFVSRLRQSIEDALRERGIRPVEGGGDLRVHFHASVRDRVEVHEADRRYYETPEYGPGTQILQWEEGTLVVDVADAASRRLLWRGWAQADLRDVIGDPDRMERRIQQAVGKMFEAFPIRPHRVVSSPEARP